MTVLAVLGALVALAVVAFVLWLGYEAIRGIISWWRDRNLDPLPGQTWRQGFDLFTITAVTAVQDRRTLHIVREPQDLLGRPAPGKGPGRWTETAEEFRARPGRILVDGPRSSPLRN